MQEAAFTDFWIHVALKVEMRAFLPPYVLLGERKSTCRENVKSYVNAFDFQSDMAKHHTHFHGFDGHEETTQLDGFEPSTRFIPTGLAMRALRLCTIQRVLRRRSRRSARSTVQGSNVRHILCETGLVSCVPVK